MENEKICGKCNNPFTNGSVISFNGEEVGAICSECQVDKTGQVAKCSFCDKEKLIVLQDSCFADRWCESCLEESRQQLKEARKFYLEMEAKNAKSNP
jgi:hypothetical protein